MTNFRRREMPSARRTAISPAIDEARGHRLATLAHAMKSTMSEIQPSRAEMMTSCRGASGPKRRLNGPGADDERRVADIVAPTFSAPHRQRETTGQRARDIEDGNARARGCARRVNLIPLQRHFADGGNRHRTERQPDVRRVEIDR